MNKAEESIWTASVKRSDRIEVGEFCPRQPYVEIQVPAFVGLVRRVVITTVSHDQGFSNDKGRFGGTYEHSNTWFEVAVITPSYHERTPSKIFQRNVHASLEPRRHENIWEIETGETSARGWLSEICSGDTIQVIPRADFKLWTNYVYEVEIKVEGDKTTRQTQSPSDTGWEAVQANKPNFYKPLDLSRQETRVLSLYPGASHEALCGRITTISLADPSHDKYEALSYCWGNPSQKGLVKLRSMAMDQHESEAEDGLLHDFPINSSLYEALKYLRPDSGPPRTLWVDAVCIDQDNLEERAQQVAQMPSIYGQADRVVIWLGLSNPIRKECFTVVQTIQTLLKTEYDPSRKYTEEELTQMAKRVMDAELTANGVVPFTDKWRQCDFDWFKRTWVVQEVANAKTAVVHCGSDMVTWPALSTLAAYISDQKTHGPLIRYGIMPSMFSSFFGSLDGKRGASLWSQHGAREEILEILIKAHSLKASDPRDKIFALLQFGAETRDIASLPSTIRPDYHKTTTQAFSDFVRWWISTHRSLRILSAVHTLPGRSWQQMYYSNGKPPDLSTLEHPTWSFWHEGEGNWAKATLGLSSESPYRASGSSIPEIDLVTSSNAMQNPSELRLSGHRLCVVTQITFYPFLERNRLPEELYDGFVTIFNPTGDKRAWLLDRDDQRTSTGARAAEDYARHLTYHSRGFTRREGDVFPCLSPSLFFSGSSDNQRVGLCPHYARPGDIVVMLYGGRVLYLIRERKAARGAEIEGLEVVEERKKYEFVGECLLHGYMNGQALAEVQEKGLAKEIFDLV
ncbi:heterokaryon incompatibility protein-domain-containing protein [Diplogelasinospora grovesii]|uniref:Heterokaryon incompatibility protein-domain-containing protein n=1 Tax=Diplogelasinospora grovesii TaxID=303347 RepID=A0AAN6MXR5_9PEZI|nr:heterokaryon incompatibility protein-domain-containing protein [Diplogelasinospora grovesii]